MICESSDVNQLLKGLASVFGIDVYESKIRNKNLKLN